jgi:spermidine/putrescine transport system permease protein
MVFLKQSVLKPASRFHFPNGIQVTNWLFAAWTSLVFLFFYLPIVLLVVYSFNDSRLNIVWRGFTLKWYGELAHNATLLRAFENSLIIAGATMLLSVVLGTLGAWLLHRYRFPGTRALGMLVFVPMVIPEVLMGVSLLMLFVSMKIQLGFTTVIIAHTTFCFPFVMVAVQARLAGIDPHLEEAALDLGARPWQAFLHVIVPYLMPAIVAGGLMAFVLSIDEYIVTFFTCGPGTQTLPLKIFGMVKTGLSPQLNALSTIFVAATVLLVIAREFFEKLWAKKAPALLP